MRRIIAAIVLAAVAVSAFSVRGAAAEITEDESVIEESAAADDLPENTTSVTIDMNGLTATQIGVDQTRKGNPYAGFKFAFYRVV